MDSRSLLVEALRLLIYVAWADGEIAPEEYDYLLAHARKHELGEDEIAILEASVRDPAKIVKPNLEALKPLRDEVLNQVKELIMADDKVDDAEVAILHRIADLLA